MRIPDKLRIGESEYTVKKCRVVDWTNFGVIGQICYSNKRMRLKMGSDERINEDTFFHEIAHGVLREMEFNYPNMVKFRNDEGFVQEMGLLLRKTFIDLQQKQKVADKIVKGEV